ncbi:hypothetical protein [Hyphomicrobium facile]|uniref:hypothetical protein n=1 Tax=Hyphomicrobium facile TaxID=51670 RepID=UPI0015A5572E|nr:hypothetical protein [Hyphomicrobium facile]
MAEFELRCRADVRFQFRFQIFAGAADIRNRKAAKVIDKAERVGARTIFDELFIDGVGREREGAMQPCACQFLLRHLNDT